MRTLKILAATAVAAAATLCAAAPALSATTTSTYSFDLSSVNAALSPNGGTMCAASMAGDWMSVTGAGTFNPAQHTVQAKGSFAHFSSTGAVVCRGTWKASRYDGFTDFGANDQGEDGGVLSMTVTHYCKTMGMTMTGIPMTVTSAVHAPAGYTEGTTVGDFAQPTGGSVIIQPDQ